MDNAGGNFPLLPRASKTAIAIPQYRKLMVMVRRKPTAIPDLPNITNRGAPRSAITKQANGKDILSCRETRSLRTTCPAACLCLINPSRSRNDSWSNFFIPFDSKTLKTILKLPPRANIHTETITPIPNSIEFDRFLNKLSIKKGMFYSTKNSEKMTSIMRALYLEGKANIKMLEERLDKKRGMRSLNFQTPDRITVGKEFFSLDL